MTHRVNLVSEANRRKLAMEKLEQDYYADPGAMAGLSAEQSAVTPGQWRERVENDEEAAHWRQWLIDHPRQRARLRPTRFETLTILACVLVGIIFAVIIAAEVLGPHW